MEHVNQQEQVIRVTNPNYQNQSDQYVTPSNRHDGIQYSHIYFRRLSEMRPRLLNIAKKKWGDLQHKDLKDLMTDEVCFIIGTIFKEMSLAPSTIKQISDHHRLLPHPPRVKYVTANDKVLLEDYVQRVPIDGIDTSNFTTGIIVALKGAEETSGTFYVSDYCFAGLPPPSSPLPSLSSDDKYVLLVSGLMVGSDWSDQWAIQQLIDYVTGQLGGEKDQELMSKIVRVIIAGNSITNKPKHKPDSTSKTKVKYRSRNYAAESVEAMKELDVFLSQLASNVPVDIMPGSYDPTNSQLPQQPFHHCMFPEASRYSSFKSVTNPYQCSIEGFKFVGTSGENIDNLYSCTQGMDSMELLEKTLNWSHLAPTTPDTLCCYPYSKSDPFILSTRPQVYFAGNQPHFQTKIYQEEGSDHQVLLVCIPKYDVTHTCVLVHLKTLSCTPLTFSTSLEQEHDPSEQIITSHTNDELIQDIDSD